MRFVPYAHFTLETRLSPQEIHTRLAAQVRPARWLNGGRAGAPYEGWVQANGFQINQVIGYRNSFLPIIQGTIGPAAEGSTIEIVMQMQWWVVAFAVVWAGGLLLFSMIALCGALSGRSSFALCIIPGVMLLFGYGVCSLGFQVEAAWATEFLCDLLARGGDGLPHSSLLSAEAPSATLLSLTPAWFDPHPTQRLPRRWVGGTPAAQRYGWGAESPPLPPPSEDGDAHETQRLPPARGDSFAATALPSAGAGGDNSELAPTIQS